jgi:uncharacterized protein
MIKETQKQQILSHLQPYRPIRVGIFGSYARNEQRPESDLDILVRFEKNINLLDLIGVEIELSDLLGVKVDLVTEQSVLPALRPYIEKDLQLIL